MDENIERSLRRLDSRMKHRIDNELADVRGWWENWTDAERAAFKAWIGRLIELQDGMPHLFPYLEVRLEFAEQIADDDFHTITPPVKAVKRAIECWERGELFTPTTLGEMAN